MKKLLTGFMSLVLASAVFASGVENKTNLSTGYLRNPSRNTENERPEAAFYNIAGTAFLKDGLWVGGGNQFVFKDYANELSTNNAYNGYGVNDYKSNDTTTVYLYPDLNAVYKTGRWSIFSNFGIYAGGGALSFSEGTSATSLMFLKGARQYQNSTAQNKLAYTAGRAAVDQVRQAIATSMGTTIDNISDEVAINYAKANGSNAADATDAQKNLYNVANVIYPNLQIWAKNATEEEKIAAASLKMAQNHSLDVTSITYGLQLGAAYLVTDWLSLSAAYRYTIGTQDMTLKCDDATFKAVNKSNKITYEATGYGQSCVFGIHAKPPVAPGLDLALQFQTLSRIDYDVDNVKGEVAQYYDITNSKKFRTDLPAVLNLGVGYSVLENLYVSTSFNWYLNDYAQQNSILSETDYDNSWEVAFGVDYRFCKYVGASVGISYGDQGITDTSNSTFNPVLNNYVIGGGFEIYPTERLTVSVACLYANYFDADYYLGGEKSQSTKTVLSKEVTNFGIGVTYFFPAE